MVDLFSFLLEHKTEFSLSPSHSKSMVLVRKKIKRRDTRAASPLAVEVPLKFEGKQNTLKIKGLYIQIPVNQKKGPSDVLPGKVG